MVGLCRGAAPRQRRHDDRSRKVQFCSPHCVHSVRCGSSMVSGKWRHPHETKVSPHRLTVNRHGKRYPFDGAVGRSSPNEVATLRSLSHRITQVAFMPEVADPNQIARKQSGKWRTWGSLKQLARIPQERILERKGRAGGWQRRTR